MVKYLKKIYGKLFKSTEEIEHQKKVEYYNRLDNKTTKTGTNFKTKQPPNKTI
jgi:hypothetical protein